MSGQNEKASSSAAQDLERLGYRIALSPGEAARAIGCSESTFRRYMPASRTEMSASDMPERIARKGERQTQFMECVSCLRPRQSRLRSREFGPSHAIGVQTGI